MILASLGSSSSGSQVIVQSNSGAITVKASSWSYLTEGVISTVIPSSGQWGTIVTITGTGMRGGGSTVASVSLGSLTAVLVASNSDT